MKRWIAAAGLMTISCVGAPATIAIDRGHDACAQCRMVIVSPSTAAEIVSPGEEPRFFDEIGCLRDYLSQASVSLPSDAVIYVADHMNGAWVEASRAIFTRTAIATPMASGLIAHVDVASRDADPAAHGGASVTADEILRPISTR